MSEFRSKDVSDSFGEVVEEAVEDMSGGKDCRAFRRAHTGDQVRMKTSVEFIEMCICNLAGYSLEDILPMFCGLSLQLAGYTQE